MARKTKSNKPVDVLRDGFLKATIWQNEGDKGPYFTVNIAKTYEKDGELHDGHSFNRTDLLAIADLAWRTYARVRQLRDELAQNQTEPPTP